MNNQEEIKYDFEIIQEANDESEIFKQTKRLLKHMLKYKFQSSEQGTSWINSINDANNRINIIINRSKGVWTRFYNNNYEINKSSNFIRCEYDEDMYGIIVTLKICNIGQEDLIEIKSV